jgi:hypothetical protein
MIIKQSSKDGSAIIKFDEKEKKIIQEKGELFFDAVSFKHLTNELMYLLLNFQNNFQGGVKNLMTKDGDVIEGKENKDV